MNKGSESTQKGNRMQWVTNLRAWAGNAGTEKMNIALDSSGYPVFFSKYIPLTSKKEKF